MTFQIQISRYFRENILEIRKSRYLLFPWRPLIGPRNPVGWDVTSGGHVLCFYKAINLTPSVSLPKTYKLKIFSCVSTAHQTSF